MLSPAAFTRTLERTGSRLMIRSVCATCGDSELVSKHDGSLQDWEDGHHCKAAEEKKKGPASATVGPALRPRKSAGRRNGGDSRWVSCSETSCGRETHPLTAKSP
jgi:hypothetical protein